MNKPPQNLEEKQAALAVRIQYAEMGKLGQTELSKIIIEAIAPLRQKIKDLEEVLEDKRRLARDLDFILNGKIAAKQPALIDLMPAIEALVNNAKNAADAVSIVSLLTACAFHSPQSVNISLSEGMWFIERPDMDSECSAMSSTLLDTLRMFNQKRLELKQS